MGHGEQKKILRSYVILFLDQLPSLTIKRFDAGGRPGMSPNSAADNIATFGVSDFSAPFHVPASFDHLLGTKGCNISVEAEEHLLRRRLVLLLGLEILPSGTTEVIRDRKGREWQISPLMDSESCEDQEAA
jgi:hypothetical protein